MIDLSSLRRQIADSPATADQFAKVGDFAINLDWVKKNAAMLTGDLSEISLLIKALGGDADLFKVIARTEGSSIPAVVSVMAYAGKNSVELRGPTMAAIDCEIEASKIGPAGYVIADIGGAKVKVQMRVSNELRNALVAAREDGVKIENYAEVSGAPALTVTSPFDGEQIPTMGQVPQRDLPAYADIIPHLTDLEVLEILEPSRSYGTPRLSVRTPDGTVIDGLIATQPIVRCLTGVYEGEAQITNEVIGRTFQIVEVEDRRRRDGELVKNESGTTQKNVVVRNTTVKRDFSF